MAPPTGNSTPNQRSAPPAEPRARRAIAAWRVASSDPNREDYLVTRDQGHWACTCEGFTHWHRTCVHITSCMVDVTPVHHAPARVLQMPAKRFLCAHCGDWPAVGRGIACRHCLEAGKPDS